MPSPFPILAYLSAFGLAVDYNVTCPDYRFCEVHHRFQSPCPYWDCSACWWGYDNCTKTEEPPSTNCPYVKCRDLPRPHHGGEVVTTIFSIAGILFVSLFARYLYRRFCRPAAAPDEEGEGEDEADDERVPFLQRCRNYFSTTEQPTSPLERLRDVMRRDRQDADPVDIRPPQALLSPSPIPSAPPYFDLEEDTTNPIIRQGGLLNENFRVSRSLDEGSSRRPEEPMDEASSRQPKDPMEEASSRSQGEPLAKASSWRQGEPLDKASCRQEDPLDEATRDQQVNCMEEILLSGESDKN